MKRILSIDVGIHTLAYCVLDFSPVTVIDWGVVDLMRWRCGRTEVDDGCMHNLVKRLSKPELVEWLAEKGVPVPAKGLKTDLQKAVIDYLQAQNIKKPKPGALDTLAIKLFTFFESKNAQFGPLDGVAIENQPCMKNPTMKSLQIMIYSYFSFRAFANKAETIMLLVSAMNKTKMLGKTGSYKERKVLAMNHAEKYVKENLPDWIELYTTSAKKDDLADALLQGLYVTTCAFLS